VSRFEPRPRKRAILAAVLGAILVLLAPSLAGAAEREFAQRYAANLNGAIAVIGNTNASCNVALTGCLDAMNGIGANLDNNDWAEFPVNADTVGGTVNSSAATLSIPAHAEVKFAGLYWSGFCTSADCPNRSQVQLRHEGQPYVSRTDAALAFVTAFPILYGGYSDITAYVQQHGAGKYWVADIGFSSGVANQHAAWSIVVAYEDYQLPPRNVSVFDGFKLVDGSGPVTVSASGFLTPPSGPVQTEIGVVGWEGDRDRTGDQLLVKSASAAGFTNLSNDLNPANNIFNTTVTVPRAGSPNSENVVSGRTEPYTNTLGLDADIFNADGLLVNGDTSAQVQASTTSESFLLSVLTFQTNLYAPNLSAVKSVVDLNGGQVSAGDILEYSIAVTNAGDDSAADVVASDPLPAGLTYVDGSASATNGAAAESGGTVTGWLGTGATAGTGGTLAPSASATLTFRARIGDDVPTGTTIANVATISGDAVTLGQRLVTASNAQSTAVAVGGYPLDVTVNGGGTVSAPAGVDDCAAGSGVCASPYLDGTSVTLTPSAPTGWDFAGWGGACSGSGSCVVSMTQARSVVATFNPTVSVNVVGLGTVGAAAGIADCTAAGGTCAASYPLNGTVTLTATPASGQSFLGWSGVTCAEGPMSPTCTVSTDRMVAARATFTGSLPAPQPDGSTSAQPATAATATGTGTSDASLTATLLPQRTRLVSGQRMRIAIRARNTGSAAADRVTSCIRLPSNLAIVRTGSALRSGRTLCFRLGDISAGSQKTRVITVRGASVRAVRRTITGTARERGEARVSAPAKRVTIRPRAVRARVTG